LGSGLFPLLNMELSSARVQEKGKKAKKVYPVRTPVFFLLERAAASYFGIKF